MAQSTDRYIAAIEIGSSRIIGAVARATESGQLDIIAVEQEKGLDGVRYGRIRNVEETSMRIARIIERLERKPAVAPRKIKGVYVGLAGLSMRSITAEASIQLHEDTEISDDVLEGLRSQARHTPIDSSLEIVDILPRTFMVDNKETSMPKGTIGSRISATYDLIACRPDLKRNIERAVADKLGLRIDGFIVTPMATGHLILSNEERRLGCMLVDMGAETTGVSIFRNGSLTYFATLPMGSRNITRDLMSLNLLEESAEDIKQSSGNAIASDVTSSLKLNNVRLADINTIIVARSEEIVANIHEQPHYAGIKFSDLTGGIICIGGGFKLNGMIDLVGSQVPARRGQLPSFVHVDDTHVPSSDIIQVAAILYAASEVPGPQSLEIPERAELPELGEGNEPDAAEETDAAERPEQQRGPSKWGRLSSKFKNWFAGAGDDYSDLLE